MSIDNIILSTPAQLPKLRTLDRFMENHAGYIAGGCFKNLFLNEPIKDIDIFFNNLNDADSAIDTFDKHPDYIKVVDLDRFVTFKDIKTLQYVQLIRSFVGSPQSIISNFDFTITKAYYSKNETTGEYEFYYHPRFFEHLVNRKLVIDDQILFPLSTFKRSYRYTRYGFGMCSESSVKLIDALQGQSIRPTIDFYFGID